MYSSRPSKAQDTAKDKSGHANQFNTKWTVEMLDLVRLRFAAGRSQSEIAAELGVTRNAIAGKLDRLGLKREAKAKPAPRVVRPPPERVTPFRAPQAFKVTIVEPVNDTPGISLLELTNTTCRRPSGTPGEADFCFCGRHGADMTEGRPYCAEHTRKARA